MILWTHTQVCLSDILLIKGLEVSGAELRVSGTQYWLISKVFNTDYFVNFPQFDFDNSVIWEKKKIVLESKTKRRV